MSESLCRNKNHTQQQQPSTEFLEALKYEMALTAETLNHEISELAAAGYLEALAGMTPEQVQAGFKRARRLLQWFPKPSEIRELALAEIEDNRPAHYYLPEAQPEWTEGERQKFLIELKAAVKWARPWVPEKPTNLEPEQPITVIFTDELREKFRKQKEELKKRYGF